MVSNAIAIVTILLFVVLIAVSCVRTAFAKRKAKPGYISQREIEALHGVTVTALRAKGISMFSFRTLDSYGPPYRELALLEIRLRRARLEGMVLTRDQVALVA